MGKRSVSVRYKSKEEKAKDPGADTTSRLTVPGPHSHPSTPKSRPKRCVETPGDPWDASQPPGSFHPAYGMPPTANRWLPQLSSSQREQSLSVQRCSQWELSPGATTRREEIPGLFDTVWNPSYTVEYFLYDEWRKARNLPVFSRCYH